MLHSPDVTARRVVGIGAGLGVSALQARVPGAHVRRSLSLMGFQLRQRRVRRWIAPPVR